MKMTRIKFLPLLAAALLAGCAKGGPQKQNIGKAEVACDATFENILDQEIDVFEYTETNPKNQTVVIPYYVSQEAAFDSLLNPDNGITAVVAARTLTDAERTRLRNRKLKPYDKQIAVDAVAIIVNNANDIPSLSIPELSDVLTGKVRLWDDLWPSTLDSITVLFDENGSSLISYMRDKVTAGQPFGPNVHAQGSSRKVFEAVNSMKGAIGIIGVSWLSAEMDGTVLSKDEVRERSTQSEVTNLGFDDNVRVLAISPDRYEEAYKPYQAYIFDGRYPLHRPIYMTVTVPGGAPKRFFDFVTSRVGQKVIQLTGVLPAVYSPRIVELTD